MVALLGQHNDFIQMPGVDSEDAELACMFVEGRTCPGWRNGIFAADGSAIPLFQKPGYFGETFYDRKSTYSMNCQVRTVRVEKQSGLSESIWQLVIMLHNLRIIDYGLGHPGSVHDAHAFLGTWVVQDPAGMIPPDHWIWADSTYPLQTWCVVPFKLTKSTGLSWSRNVYNKHLSKVTYCSKVSITFNQRPRKVRIRVEHAFVALKGRFQSLRELQLVMRTQKNVKVAMHWIQCCLILHNMILQFKEELGVEKTTNWAQ